MLWLLLLLLLLLSSFLLSTCNQGVKQIRTVRKSSIKKILY